MNQHTTTQVKSKHGRNYTEKKDEVYDELKFCNLLLFLFKKIIKQWAKL